MPVSGPAICPEEDDLPEPPSKEIFVFTPSGELRKLAAGATVLDFAFDIHSNLGIRCTGGKVNGKAVPIKEKLQTGDVVEIMSGKNQKPSADWLNFVVTSKARTKIRQKLSEAEFRKAAEGKELLERRLKNWKLELGDEDMAALMKKLQYKNVNAFFAAVGEGSVDIAEIKSFLDRKEENRPAEDADRQPEKSQTPAPRKQNGPTDDILVIDARNLRSLDYKMAKCCNPVYGDDVFGFVSIKDGIKIHRMSCTNAARLMELYPYRIQKVMWSDSPSNSSFQVTLKIVAAHEQSVINEIFDTVNAFKASIRNFNVSDNDRSGTYDIQLKLSVPNNLELDKVISQIRIKKNIIKVSRM